MDDDFSWSVFGRFLCQVHFLHTSSMAVSGEGNKVEMSHILTVKTQTLLYRTQTGAIKLGNVRVLFLYEKL